MGLKKDKTKITDGVDLIDIYNILDDILEELKKA